METPAEITAYNTTLLCAALLPIRYGQLNNCSYRLGSDTTLDAVLSAQPIRHSLSLVPTRERGNETKETKPTNILNL